MIDDQKAKGKDVTLWQKNLDDAKSTAYDDVERLNNQLTLITALKPSDYGVTSKNTITLVNTNIRLIAKDLQGLSGKVKKPAALKMQKKEEMVKKVIQQ